MGLLDGILCLLLRLRLGPELEEPALQVQVCGPQDLDQDYGQVHRPKEANDPNISIAY